MTKVTADLDVMGDRLQRSFHRWGEGGMETRYLQEEISMSRKEKRSRQSEMVGDLG